MTAIAWAILLAALYHVRYFSKVELAPLSIEVLDRFTTIVFAMFIVCTFVEWFIRNK